MAKPVEDNYLITIKMCIRDRPYFVYDASFAGQSCGGMDVQMAREFFYACLLYTSRCV